MLLELNEVEAGMYETTPSHTHYFLQTLAAINKERITDDLFGEWQFTRGTARVICQMTLGNTAHDTDSFVLTLKPGCDPLITRFAPGGLAARSRPVRDAPAANGQSWRFEESEENIWSRIPAMRPPMHDDAAAAVGISGKSCSDSFRETGFRPTAGSGAASPRAATSRRAAARNARTASRNARRA